MHVCMCVIYVWRTGQPCLIQASLACSVDDVQSQLLNNADINCTVSMIYFHQEVLWSYMHVCWFVCSLVGSLFSLWFFTTYTSDFPVKFGRDGQHRESKIILTFRRSRSKVFKLIFYYCHGLISSPNLAIWQITAANTRSNFYVKYDFPLNSRYDKVR